jgi:uncharacterized SAM-binding protein YcdF (DUF218 family)
VADLGQGATAGWGDSLNIFLHKILPVLALPTGLILLLLLAGLLLRRRGLIWTALVLFWVCSTPLVSDFMARAIENGVELVEATSMPTADAIVVLSEGRVVAPGAAKISEWRDGDRFWGGVSLYQAGKAPLLVFTGGWSPGQVSAKLESEVLISYAKALGVPSKALRTTGLVVNTAEEAQAVATLLGRQVIYGNGLAQSTKVLLVTSAYHMPRAQRLFEHAGLTVIAYPVDFQVQTSRNLSVIDFLPSAIALQKTEMSWRETLGRVYYEMMSFN